MALLRERSAVGKEVAAGALRNLAINAENKVRIAGVEGALAALVALLREGSTWWARRRRCTRCTT